MMRFIQATPGTIQEDIFYRQPVELIQQAMIAKQADFDETLSKVDATEQALISKITGPRQRQADVSGIQDSYREKVDAITKQLQETGETSSTRNAIKDLQEEFSRDYSQGEISSLRTIQQNLTEGASRLKELQRGNDLQRASIQEGLLNKYLQKVSDSNTSLEDLSGLSIGEAYKKPEYLEPDKIQSYIKNLPEQLLSSAKSVWTNYLGQEAKSLDEIDMKKTLPKIEGKTKAAIVKAVQDMIMTPEAVRYAKQLEESGVEGDKRSFDPTQGLFKVEGNSIEFTQDNIFTDAIKQAMNMSYKKETGSYGQSFVELPEKFNKILSQEALKGTNLTTAESTKLISEKYNTEEQREKMTKLIAKAQFGGVERLTKEEDIAFKQYRAFSGLNNEFYFKQAQSMLEKSLGKDIVTGVNGDMDSAFQTDFGILVNSDLDDKARWEAFKEGVIYQQIIKTIPDKEDRPLEDRRLTYMYDWGKDDKEKLAKEKAKAMQKEMLDKIEGSVETVFGEVAKENLVKTTLDITSGNALSREILEGYQGVLNTGNRVDIYDGSVLFNGVLGAGETPLSTPQIEGIQYGEEEVTNIYTTLYNISIGLDDITPEERNLNPIERLAKRGWLQMTASGHINENGDDLFNIKISTEGLRELGKLDLTFPESLTSDGNSVNLVFKVSSETTDMNGLLNQQAMSLIDSGEYKQAAQVLMMSDSRLAKNLAEVKRVSLEMQSQAEIQRKIGINPNPEKIQAPVKVSVDGKPFYIEYVMPKSKDDQLGGWFIRMEDGTVTAEPGATIEEAIGKVYNATIKNN